MLEAIKEALGILFVAVFIILAIVLTIAWIYFLFFLGTLAWHALCDVGELIYNLLLSIPIGQ
jgi:hypothetical protein